LVTRRRKTSRRAAPRRLPNPATLRRGFGCTEPQACPLCAIRADGPRYLHRPTGGVAGWKTPRCRPPDSVLPARVHKLWVPRAERRLLRPFRRRLHPCPDRFRSDQRRWVSASGAFMEPQPTSSWPTEGRCGRNGDGQARGELLSGLPPEISPRSGRSSGVGPRRAPQPGGAIVDPRPLDADLRLQWGVPHRSAARAPACVTTTGASPGQPLYGVGKMHHASGGVCAQLPGHGEERHFDRRPGRLLFEMANGQFVKEGWRSPEWPNAGLVPVRAKAANAIARQVDMATYNRVPSHHYAGRSVRGPLFDGMVSVGLQAAGRIRRWPTR